MTVKLKELKIGTTLSYNGKTYKLSGTSWSTNGAKNHKTTWLGEQTDGDLRSLNPKLGGVFQDMDIWMHNNTEVDVKHD